MTFSKKKWVVWTLSATVLLLIVVAAGVFYQLRNLDNLKTVLAQELSGLANRQVTVDRVELDFTDGLGVWLKEVRLYEKNGTDVDCFIEKAEITLRLLPLLRGNVVIRSLTLMSPVLQITRDAEGQYNFGDFVEGATSAPSSGISDWVRLRGIKNFQILGGGIRFVDYKAKPGMEPVILQVRNLDLDISKSILFKPLSLEMQGDIVSASGIPAQLHMEGKVHASDDLTDPSKIQFQGKVEVDRLDMPLFEPYLHAAFTSPEHPSWLWLRSEMKGTLDGRIHATGSVIHAPQARTDVPVLSSQEHPDRGGLKYDLTLARDTIQFDRLDYQAGSFLLQARGRVGNFMSRDPAVDFTVSSSEFALQETDNYLPFQLFPKQAHDVFQKILRSGKMELHSLNYQ